jgi:hypothetical protein
MFEGARVFAYLTLLPSMYAVPMKGLMWWIHDYRLEIHHELKKKALEYKRHQRDILEKTVQLHQDRLVELRATGEYSDDENSNKEGSEVSDELDFYENDHISGDAQDVILAR